MPIIGADPDTLDEFRRINAELAAKEQARIDARMAKPPHLRYRTPEGALHLGNLYSDLAREWLRWPVPLQADALERHLEEIRFWLFERGLAGVMLTLDPHSQRVCIHAAEES